MSGPWCQERDAVEVDHRPVVLDQGCDGGSSELAAPSCDGHCLCHSLRCLPKRTDVDVAAPRPTAGQARGRLVRQRPRWKSVSRMWPVAWRRSGRRFREVGQVRTGRRRRLDGFLRLQLCGVHRDEAVPGMWEIDREDRANPSRRTCNSMSDKKAWLVTGAGRGLGVDIAKAALAAGHAVVATGRNPEKVSAAVGEHDDLLAVKLDVTDPADAASAVGAAVDRFGRIDVLVNNAGNFNAGFFEELSPEEFRAQIETTLFGPVNVTRAALPVMRAQRSGLVVTISSTAGLEGGEFVSAYAASKFGVEGWMESLAPEVAPFGIRTMLVEPGFFRTELLTPESTKYAASSIEDYAERTEQTVTAWKAMNGQQGGDPAKLADALVYLAGQEEPPLRFAAGADAVAAFERRANNLLGQANAYRDLSSSLALDSD